MRYILKHTILWIGALLMLPCLSSCQSEDDNLDADTTVSLYLGSLDKPVYPEEINLLRGSRASDDVPENEEDASDWVDDDVVKLSVNLASATGDALIDKTVNLTYDGTAFVSEDNLVSISENKINLVLSLQNITAIKTADDNTYSLTVSASYSPSSGPSYGATAEWNSSPVGMKNSVELNGDLGDIELKYTTARLRVYAVQNNISISFIDESKTTNATTNAKGNAYYFGNVGTLIAPATSGFTIKQGETLIYAASAYNPVTLEAGKAYAIDATFYIPSNP